LSHPFFLPVPAGENGEQWFGRAAQTGMRAASAPNERETESFSGRMVRPERFGVQLDPKLALLGKGKLHKPDFEVLLPAIILDRNSQICFHKFMAAAELNNSTTPAAGHAPSGNHCSVAQDANTKQP
jgi:hypothetical protein